MVVVYKCEMIWLFHQMHIIKDINVQLEADTGLMKHYTGPPHTPPQLHHHHTSNLKNEFEVTF